MTKYVAISGSICAGKTTLARKLAAHLDYTALLEQPDANPYLRNTRNAEGSAFKSQMWFLAEKAVNLDTIANSNGPYILDRSLYEDALIARCVLSASEYRLYEKYYTYVMRRSPAPALMIYLRVPVSCAWARLSRRRKVYERAISRDFLARLQQRYEKWHASFNVCPVITAGDQEFDLPAVVHRVKTSLEGGSYGACF